MSLYSKLDRLASDLEAVKTQLNAVANTNQLQRTSVEGGAIEFNDEDGNLKAIMGGQDDGGYTTVVVSGPVPPVPTNYGVDVDFGKAVVHWSGDFENALVAPSDWSRTEVYAQPGAFVSPSREYARGSMVAASGGSVTIGLTKGQWTFCLVAWSQAGRMSAMSTPVTVDIPGYGDIVLAEIDAAETAIKNAGEMLVDGQQTLADKLANMGEGMDPEQIAQDIATARQEAIDAALEEINAVEGSLTSLIGDKNTTTWSTANPPTEYAGVVGDTWIKLTSLGSGGREIERRRWSGTTWVVHKVDGAVLSNVDASTITTGFLDVVNRIRAGSILADKLLIGGPTNLIPSNPDPTVVDFPDLTYDATEKALRAEGKGTHYTEAEFTLPAGKYLMSADLKASVAGTTCYVGIYAPTPRWSYGINNQTLTTDWVTYSGIIEIGEDRAGVPHVIRYLPAYNGDSTAVTWMRNLSLRSMVGGTLITPGGVQTPHLAADVLEVGNLKAGTAAIAEAVVKKLFAEVVVAQMVTATEFIGENAILTGAVTAPKLTVTEEMWAKFGEFVKIRAGQIEADAIDGMVITGPNIRTSASGARVQLDTGGVRVFDEDNDVRTSLSPFGSTFKGEVEAETLVVNDGAEFKSDNTLAQGASLTLAAGVTDPTAPPVVQPFWDGLEFTPANINGSSPVGLAWDGTNYITVGANGVTNGVANYFTGVYAMKINGETGEASRLRCDFSAASENERRVSEVFGVTCIGSELFFLGRYGYKGYVWVTDLDGVFKRRFDSPDIGYSATNPLKYRPGIGNDGANLVTAQCTDTGTLGWGFISKTNGSVLAGGLDRGDATKSDITGVYVGNGDLGTKYVVVAKRSTATVQVFGTDGSATDYSWYTESGDVGIVFHDGAFHTLNPSGIVHKYTDTNTGDNSGDWWAAYRWTADATPEDEYITHWSRISPPKRFTWPRRAQLRIMGQPLPVGVDFIGPVLAKKTSTPARTDFHAPSWWPRSGTSVAWYDTLPTNWETSTTPRDENNFPGSTPSVLKSANSLFEANGDGTGRWGPISWLSDGTVRGATEAGEVIVPINAANANRTLAVTFPSGRFKTPPTVVATPVTPDPQTSQVSVSNITAAGFTMVARRTVASNAYVRWIATEG